MSVSEWKEAMTDRNDYGESAYALHLIIMRSAVCGPCKDDDHFKCLQEAWDIIAGKPIDCQCIICPVSSDILMDEFESETMYADNQPVVLLGWFEDGTRIVIDFATPIHDQIIKEKQ